MPLPKPQKGESEAEFIKRFMKNPQMKKEYPDLKQRLAIAFSTFRRAKEVIKNELQSDESSRNSCQI